MHMVQYISPLQANFDLTLSNESRVYLLEQNDSVTFQWRNVILEHHPELGGFTFQVTFVANNDLIFVYESIPKGFADVAKHQTKLNEMDANLISSGISDAYEHNGQLHGYHRVPVDIGKKCLARVPTKIHK